MRSIHDTTPYVYLLRCPEGFLLESHGRQRHLQCQKVRVQRRIGFEVWRRRGSLLIHVIAAPTIDELLQVKVCQFTSTVGEFDAEAAAPLCVRLVNVVPLATRGPDVGIGLSAARSA